VGKISETDGADAAPGGAVCVDRLADPQLEPHQHDGGLGTHAGENCVSAACHGEGGTGPRFQFAGTVYKADRITPNAGVTVRVAGMGGMPPISDSAGNFSSTSPITFPTMTDVTACPTVTPMLTAEMRATAHGDVVHSRPVAINLGTDTSPQVVVFYGGNDGVLRAINGNRTDAIGSVSAGEELWSFMPPEFYGNIKRLYENTVQINFANVTDPAALPTPYGMDGAVSAHLHSTGAWVYSTMRRGGRVIYAFNIDKTSPTNSTLKWKQGCPNLGNDTDCSTGFTEMGSPARCSDAPTATRG
jgi:hypothetical protein